MKRESVLREIFSGENGRLSSKRIIGTIAMAIAIGCTVYLTVVDRSTETVENLLMTILITSGSLIGAATVTGIWRGNKMSVGGESEQENSQRSNLFQVIWKIRVLNVHTIKKELNKSSFLFIAK